MKTAPTALPPVEMANDEKGASGAAAKSDAQQDDPARAKIEKWKNEGRIIKHTRMGVWDQYVEVDPDAGKAPTRAAVVKKYESVIGAVPYVARMVKDVFGIPGCKLQAVLYVGASLGTAVLPAATLW